MSNDRVQQYILWRDSREGLASLSRVIVMTDLNPKRKTLILFVDTNGKTGNVDEYIKEKEEELQNKLGDEYHVVAIDSRHKIKVLDDEDETTDEIVTPDGYTYPYYYPTIWHGVIPPNGSPYPPTHWDVTCSTASGTTNDNDIMNLPATVSISFGNKNTQKKKPEHSDD